MQRGEPARESGLTLYVPALYVHITSEALEARRLVDLRDRWLNPPEWVEWVDEPVKGYPKRPVPRSEDAARALKKRTLTNLYNARPQWLADAHVALDAAVADAYGWPPDISDDDVLRELPGASCRDHGRGSPPTSPTTTSCANCSNATAETERPASLGRSTLGGGHSGPGFPGEV